MTPLPPTARAVRALLPLVLVGVATVATGCTPGLDPRPERVVEGRELYYFDDVEKMLATSELVVKGRVLAATPGRWSGVPKAEDSAQLRDIKVAVEEVLFSKGRGPQPVIHVDEWGYDHRGRGFQFGNVAWTDRGTVAYYFLQPVEGQPNTYRLTSSQGRMVVVDGALTSSAAAEDELRDVVEAMDENQLRDTIGRGANGYRSGRVKPVPGPDRQSPQQGTP